MKAKKTGSGCNCGNCLAYCEPGEFITVVGGIRLPVVSTAGFYPHLETPGLRSTARKPVKPTRCKKSDQGNPGYGAALRRAIDGLGITQAAFSKLIGYSEQQVSKVIHGHHRVSPTFRERTEKVLGRRLREEGGQR